MGSLRGNFAEPGAIRTCGQEEAKSLHNNVVEQEDETVDQSCRVKHGVPDDAAVHLVDDFGRSDVLRLDTGSGESLLFRSEPAGVLRGFWQEEVTRADG